VNAASRRLALDAPHHNLHLVGEPNSALATIEIDPRLEPRPEDDDDGSDDEQDDGWAHLDVYTLDSTKLSRCPCTTSARSKRTVQAPGRLTFLLGKPRSDGDPVTTLRRAVRWWIVRQSLARRAPALQGQA
jgi:hypothetical protein